MAYFGNTTTRGGGPTIPAVRQQSDNARRRRERRNADRHASNERWQTILKGAAAVFRREGFARTRLEDIAVEVGINRASLYYYVGTKEELLLALIEAPAYEMTRHCREALESVAAPEEKLRRALASYIEDLVTHPELFVLFGESQHIATIAGAQGIVSNAESYGKTLLAIIEEGVTGGVFRSDLDPRLVMLGILGMYNWIHRWYVPGGRNSLTEIGGTFAAMVLSGLRP
ncbi:MULTISPECIES: TetR/AcrR family transcriptional regulator [Mycobacterium]|uniref:TetR/AcrR family transcriptional regulator n=1 Tax=Mycobacterium colombiense TaxID=339268 RepID=A0A329MBS0_9MYCO|nr:MULTISPECIES: TetR/AcrR family transcriptional regulator [Mycobacterium]MDM4139383.1 TetR/AcrR family transcriptional regulator [Mycobacterium sp. FLAC0960]RAV16596.1 TetR/AcrR family transcriptional regulator [Mycobacterium colombiense]